MRRQLTSIVKREGDGYVALCPEVDVTSQGDSAIEARENLEGALALFFETASAEEIERRLRNEVYVTRVEVAVGQAGRPKGSIHSPRVAGDAQSQRPTQITRMVDRLGAAAPIRADDCPNVPKKPGLYMFTEDGRVMWVGKAKDLRQRIEHHTHYHHRGRHRTTSLLASTLANNMAARATGRKMDAGDRFFRKAVLEAGDRIRERMEVRWLLVADPATRSVCERAAIARYRPEFNRSV